MWLLLLLFAADRPADQQWAARTEGAAVKLGVLAGQLAATADQSREGGRVVALAPLRHDADELARQANLLVRFASAPPGGPTDDREAPGR